MKNKLKLLEQVPGSGIKPTPQPKPKNKVATISNQPKSVDNPTTSPEEAERIWKQQKQKAGDLASRVDAGRAENQNQSISCGNNALYNTVEECNKPFGVEWINKDNTFNEPNIDSATNIVVEKMKLGYRSGGLGFD